MLRLFATRELVTLLFLPMAVYVDTLLLGIQPSHWRFVLQALALTYGISGFTLSLLVMGWLLHRALRHRPSEPEGRRLARLLALPWQLILLGNLVMWVLGGFIFNTTVAYLMGSDAPETLLGMAVAGGMGLLNGTLLFVLYEKRLMPIALEEFQRLHRARPSTRTPFRPRQRWFIPYVLASLLFCSLVFTGTVVWVKLTAWKDQLVANLPVDKLARGTLTFAEHLQHLHAEFRDDVLGSVGATIALMLSGSAATVWWMGQRQRDGAAAVYTSLEGLVHGSPTPPLWVSNDEMGDLAAGVWRLFAWLEELPRELRASTVQLSEASATLSKANGEQEKTLMRQSGALQESATTAEEIHQLSVLTQQRVQTVLERFARTDKLGQDGKEAVAQSQQQLDEIADSTRRIGGRVGQLAKYKQDISAINETVKTLANRSRVLAINGAILAAQSGEQGRSFAVVTKEFRALADLSSRASEKVSGIIDALDTALSDTISLVEQGTQDVKEAVEQLHKSHAPLVELLQCVKESAVDMRVLTEAVGQQHQGIEQLSQATHELRRLTDETLAHVGATQAAARICDSVSGEVGEIARRYATAEPPTA